MLLTLQCLLEVRRPELLTVPEELGLRLLPIPHDLISTTIPPTRSPNLDLTPHKLQPLLTLLRRAAPSLIGIIFLGVRAFHDA